MSPSAGFNIREEFYAFIVWWTLLVVSDIARNHLTLDLTCLCMMNTNGPSIIFVYVPGRAGSMYKDQFPLFFFLLKMIK